ncbi:hypothetical protein FA95DRAFT_1007728 [Auriscalpium vulgare]|uniref:Uncharacterized protein n=1 Tax=Auriscalpium vulgare TaxID=40419 RepID=A0ACB8RYQ7_9AGAM|nr:hypothetical protein FA95DRAFT_1007728 [Auriscalpium vulgare]
MDGSSDSHSHSMEDLAVDVGADVDTCRICSAPAEPEQPLFYPCKCSGTIRYIHQDCLTTWLAHSKKKTCDVCKHPYAFTKVYAEDMPQHLPSVLLVRRFAQHTLFMLLFCVRAIVVSFVWLAILPWITVWTWRLYFAMGNSTAWWISARPRSPGGSTSFFFYNLTSRSQPSTNDTSLDASAPLNGTASSTWDHLVSHPVLRSVSADIFTGQIIAALIILAFIAVFLLREWISQNARPGVFEDAEMPDEDLERERDHERERLEARHAQRDRELQVLRERNVQLERMGDRLRDLERLAHRRQIDRERRMPQVGEGVVPEDGQPRHPDRPIRDLPARPPSVRARLHAEDPPEAGGSSSASASNGDLPTGEEIRQASLDAALRRRRGTGLESARLPPTGEEIREASLRAMLRNDQRGLTRVDRTGSDEPGPSGKGKGKERGSQAVDSLTLIRQKRAAAGVKLAITCTLYEFEKYEIKRLDLDNPLSIDNRVLHDPSELYMQAERERKAAGGQGLGTSISLEYALSYRLPLKSASLPDDWTEKLGSAEQEAIAWRQIRKMLYEIWQEEALEDGLEPVHIPKELVDVEVTIRKFFDALTILRAVPPPAPRPPTGITHKYPVEVEPIAKARLHRQKGPAPRSTSEPIEGSRSTMPPFPIDLEDSFPSSRPDLPGHSQLFDVDLDASGNSVARRSAHDSNLPKHRKPAQLQRYKPGVDSLAPGEGTSRPPSVLATTSSTTESSTFSFAAQDPSVAERLFDAKQTSALPYPFSPSAAASSSSVTSAPPPPYSGRQAQPPSSIPVPRRPPMPSATLPTPTTPPASLRNKAPTPLASPSLATYRPPEEFQDESPGYFDPLAEEGDNLGIKDFAEEHANYFRDVNDPNVRVHTERIEIEFDDDDDDDEEEDEDGLPALLLDSEDDDGDDELIQGEEALGDDEGRAAWAQNWEDNRQLDVEIPEAPDVAPEAGGPALDELEDGALAAQLLEDDIGVEDDMEGALEAIGLRGPLYVVAQNAALMIFVLATAMGLGIGLPFTFGKSTALLSLDPKRALQVLHWPIKLMRVITDPIVDSVLFILGRIFLPALLRVCRAALFAALWIVKAGASRILGVESIDKAAGFVQATVDTVYDQPWDKARDFLVSLPSRALPADPSPSPSALERLLESDHPLVRFLEPYFNALGKEVRVTSASFQEGWVRLALSDTNPARVFAVFLGYGAVGLLLAFYLNVLTVGSVKSAGRAVRSAVRQQLLVVKVAAFIVIELVLFPLGCGINLDLCSIWLFPEASLQSRLAFLKYAPLTATFYHWVVGTMFMYQFAILLAGCRTIMRPGAMWFIKDPADPNFHPIRDILERPALVQLRKLSVSAVMYGLVVACGIGSIGGVMRAGSGTILPLRWRPREPLSDVPVDLLFLHALLPYTLRFFRPRRLIRTFSVHIWKHLCKHLRLTSYMFGQLHPDEEYTPRRSGWLGLRGGSVAEAHVFDGNYRRVPASDNVAVPRDMRATAAVDIDGQPIDDEARQLIATQNLEADKARRSVADDYTIVYIPPHFRYRIAAFIAALWVIGCVFVALSVSCPILLGRRVFKLFTAREVHDGYSFFVGFYLLWGSWVVGYSIERMDRRRQRRTSDEPRAEWPLYLAKRTLLWLAKISYMVFFLGIVIPILIALVVEVYMVLPIRLTFNKDLVPRIRVVDMWALGIVYAKIFLHAHNMRPRDRITNGIRNIKIHGWTSPDPIRATTEIIAPMLAGLIGMLLLPPVIVLLINTVAPVKLDDRFILMHVYPTIFAGAGVARIVLSTASVLGSWSQSIRDKEFLVEMRLRNYEQDQKNSEASVSADDLPALEDGAAVGIVARWDEAALD